jgi:hypothetical protein
MGRSKEPGRRRGVRRWLPALLIVLSLLSVGLFLIDHSWIPGTPNGNAGLTAAAVANPFVDQSATKACGSVSTCNTAGLSLPFAGDSIFVDIGANTSGLTISAVNDNYGDTLTLVQSSAGSSNVHLWVYSEYNFAHAGTFRIWVNVSTTATYSFQWVAVAGVPGISPVDVTGSAATGHSTAISASGTTTVANDLVLLFISASGSDAITATSGSTLVQTTAGAATSALLDQVDSSTGSFTESATGGNIRFWVSFVVGLKLGTTPAAPTGLAQTGATTSAITWTWTAPLGAVANYSVWNYKNSACTTLNVTASVVPASYTFSSLGSAEVAWVKVAAFNSTGQGALTSCVAGAALPNAPTSPSAASTSSTSTILVSWTNPGGTLTDNYVFWQAGSACGSATKIDIGSVVTSYTVTGLTTNALYCFYAQAVSLGGASASSSIVTARVATVPAAPTGLTVGTVTASSVPLSWTAPGGGGITNYTAWRWTGASCSGTVAQTYSVGTGTSYTVTSLSGATSYSFKVSAFNATGGSPLSSCVAATTLPGAPTSPSVTATTTSSVSLSWTNPSGTLTDSYVFYQIHSLTCSSPTQTDIGSVVTSYTQTGLSSGALYCFYIEAVSAGGAGAASSIVSAVTNTVPGAPTGLAVGTVTATSVDLSWTAPGGGGITNYTAWRWTGTSCSGTVAQTYSVGTGTSYTVSSLPGATGESFKVSAWNTTGGSALTSCVSATTLPGIPTALTVTATTTTSVSLSWTNPSGTLTDSYVYFQIHSLTCTAPTLTDVGSSVSSYTQTGLSSGALYCFYVKAVSAGGAGAASSIVTVVTNTVPGPPTGLTVGTVTASSVALSWTAPSGGGITNYTVWRWTGASCSGTYAQSYSVGTGTTYAVSSLPGATSESFEVSAYNVTGGSALSSCVAATTLPGVPTGLSVTATTTTSVSLSWTNPSGTLTDSYVYFQLHSSTCSSPTLTDVGSSVTSYTQTGLSSGALYCFFVEAVSAGGAGAASSIVTAVTNTVPAPPTGLATGTVTVSSIDLSWTGPGGGGILNYTAWRWTGSSCSGSYAQSYTVGTGTTYTVGSLPSATTEAFEVSAWNATGNSALSSCVSSTTLPSAPTSLAVTSVSSSSVGLSWSNPSGSLTDVLVFFQAHSTSCSSPTQDDIGSVVTARTESGLSGGTTYCFFVEAKSAGGASAPSAIVTAFTNTTPAAPSGLSANPISATSITLAWTNPGGGGLTSITVEYGPNCSALSTSIVLAVVTTATIGGLTPASGQSFAIAASNISGRSPFSSCVSSGTLPAPVTSLLVASVGPTWAVLSWILPVQAPINVTLLSGPTCGVWNRSSSAGVTTAFNLTGLLSNAGFCVVAEDWSSWGTNLSSTASAVTLPLPPTGLQETALGAHFVDLAWVQPRGTLTSNTIVWSTTCGNWTNSAEISPAAAVYGSDGLAASTHYCFAVTARNSTLSSGTSSALIVVTEPDPSGTPTGGGGFLLGPGNDIVTQLENAGWVLPLILLLVVLGFVSIFWFLLAGRRRRRRR